MARRLLPALLVLLVLAPPASAQYEVQTRRCGDVAGGPWMPQNVRAELTTCRRAKRVARRHAARCDLRRRRCTVMEFTCRRRFFGNSGTRVSCVNGPQRVRFFYGV